MIDTRGTNPNSHHNGKGNKKGSVRGPYKKSGVHLGGQLTSLHLVPDWKKRAVVKALTEGELHLVEVAGELNVNPHVCREIMREAGIHDWRAINPIL